MTIKQKILRGVSYLIVLLAIYVISTGVYKTKFWIPTEDKISTLSTTTGATPAMIQGMTGDCLGYIEAGCTYAPIALGRRISVHLAEIKTIGGKWGASMPIIDTSLNGLKVTPPKSKNWGSSITDQPSKDVDISLRLTLEESDQPIHQAYETTISMGVVMPTLSGAFQFSEQTETYKRTITIFTVSEEEFKLLINLNNGWDGILISFFFSVIILFIALITYVNSIDTPPVKRRK